MRIVFTFIFALGAIAGFVSQSTGATTQPTTRLSESIPTEAGHHPIQYYTTIDGHPVQMCVMISNSQLIAKTPGRVPAMIFLCGVGDRGSDGQSAFYNGPAAEMVRYANLDQSLPMMVISPICPLDRRWDDPGMPEAMVRFTQLIAADPRIDPDRIYLTGLSMGGKGTWEIGAAGAKYFAALVPTSAPEVSPEITIPAVKDLPMWIVAGNGDIDEFKQGSIHMAADMRKAGAPEVFLSLLPEIGHNTWELVYPKPEFYQWLLTHARGKPPAKKYTEAEMLKIAMTPINDPVAAKVRRDFWQFSPDWYMVNCATRDDPGLHAEANGRKHVMVVHPISQQVPCRMQTTWEIPPGKHGKLTIIAGCDAKNDWKLIVQVAHKDVLSVPISASTTNDNWRQFDFDLPTTQYVHVEVFAAANNDEPTTAYFAKLGIEVK